MRLLVLAALLAVLVLAGCGGDDEPEASAAAPIERWVTQADAICARTSAQVRTLAGKTFGTEGKVPTRPAQRAYDAEILRLQRANLDELRGLEAPAGDEQRVNAVLDALESVLVEQEALDVDDPGQPTETPTRFDRLARELGLRSCVGG